MSNNFPRYLKLLNECLPGVLSEGSDNSSAALLIAEDIFRECQLLNSNSEIANTCSILCNANDGILCFLKKSMLHDQFVTTRVKLFELLEEFIRKHSSFLFYYYKEIKDIALLIYNYDKTAKMRIRTVQVLSELIITSSGRQVGFELDPGGIMERFILELAKSSRMSPTILQAILELLGRLAENFPEHVNQFSEKLLKIYLVRLEKQMKSKTNAVEFPVICGCFNGLTSLLNVIGQSLSDETLKTIYEYISLAISYNKDVKRFEFIRAVLNMFVKHSALFRVHIYRNWLKTYESLKEWFSYYSNNTVKTAAVLAVEAYFKQIAAMLCQNLESSCEKRIEAERTFKHFVEIFCDILGKNELTHLSIAVHGYSHFAAPCKRLLSDNEVNLMFIQIIRRAEDLFFKQDVFVQEKLGYLPGFVGALSSILLHLDEVFEVHLVPLSNLVISLIENYPDLSSKNKPLSWKAIIRLCVSLHSKRTLFKSLTRKIIYQGILRTCLHPIPQDMTTGASVGYNEEQLDIISYRSYIEFWKSLLQIVELQELNDIGVSIDDRHLITHALYDEIITSVLAIISKLDFSLAKDSTNVMDEQNSDPIYGLHATKPKDFLIFVNLVEFCKAFLINENVLLFEKWIYVFGQKMILFSTKFPLVSGFYKLMSTVLKNCTFLKYFENSHNILTMSNVFESDVKRKSFILFTKFVKEVSVRLHQYKEELLNSCIEVILSLPKEIVMETLHCVSPVIVKAVTLGYNFLPMIENVLTALECWSSEISPETILPLYQEVIPHLNGYITIFNKSVKSDAPVLIGGKKLKTSVKECKPEISSKEWTVKLRIIKLLGNLGNNINSVLIDNRAESIAKEALSWDSNKFMKFALPFVDMKPTLHLDEFLSHVVQLACFSNDRQSKVAAAELLHSLILYLIGSQASLQTALQLEKPITKLLAKLIPAVLKLACDLDTVLQQLYHPLVFQLIHWFSSRRKEIANDYATLFECLMEGITNSDDILLRDLCAQGIKELLLWTIKHSSVSEMKRNPYGTKFILKRMYSFCLHPMAALRLGAALIFNNIYTVFREEEDLVDRFIIEILYYFIESLAMSEMDEKHLSTRHQCTIALSHVEKIISGKTTMLLKQNKNRRKPLEFENFSSAKNDWEKMLMWLLNQWGRQEAECRHFCMSLFIKFAMHSEAKSAEKYFRSTLEKQGVNFLVSIFEGDGKTKSEILQFSNFPILTDLNHSFCFTGATTWLNLILGSLDCYTFVIGNKLLEPNELFSRKTSSVLLKGIHYFTSKIALVDVFATFKMFKLSLAKESDILTPKEINEYNYLKCTVIVRVVDFIDVVCRSANVEANLDSIVNSSLWNMIAHCVFHPTDIGFDMEDTTVSSQLSLKIKSLLQTIVKRFPKFDATMKLYFTNFINEFGIWSPIKTASTFVNSDDSQFYKLKWIIAGFRLLNTLDYLQPILNITSTDQIELGNVFLSNAVEMSIFSTKEEFFAKTLENIELDVAREVLLLSFSFELPISVLLELANDETQIRHTNSQMKLSKGEHFLTTFYKEVMIYLMEKAIVSIPYLMSNMLEVKSVNDPLQFNGVITNILICLLDFLKSDSILKEKFGRVVVQQIVNNWNKLKEWWRPFVSTEIKESCLHILLLSMEVDHKLFQWQDDLYFQTFLNLVGDTNLDVKFKNRLLTTLTIIINCSLDKSDALKAGLIKFLLMHFPLRSTELAYGNSKYNEYITAFKKIMQAFEITGSSLLLELLVELMCIEKIHICDDFLTLSLAKYMRSSNLEKQEVAIHCVYNIFKNSTAEHEAFRQTVVEKFINCLLRKASKTVFVNFYVNNIVDIAAFIMEKSLKTTDPNYQKQLAFKLSSFILIETLYSRCSGDELNTPDSIINKAFCKGSVKTGKELTQEVTRTAHNVKKENMHGETAYLELRRQVRCAAYNCLIAVISCTQTDVKFYTGLLFTENPLKGDFLWENLVDSNKKFSFEVELSKPLERRNTLISIRKKSRKMNDSVDYEVEDDVEEVNSSLRISLYDMTSQILMESSLADEISHLNGKSSLQKTKLNVSKRKKANIESEGYLEMEMDVINQHECMISLNRLLKYLHEHITPVTADNHEMPPWMKALHKTFCTETTSINVKLFFAKLIINNDKIFEPFANFWMLPLMQLIVQGAVGKDINYFVADIIVVLLSWAPKALPLDTIVERSVATKLLEFLINNANQERRDIFRNNLEIIKTVIECWKTRLDIPTLCIFDHFKCLNTKSKESLIGILLTGIVVSCGLPPYNSVIGLNEEKFYNTLAMNMHSKTKEIYSSAAEVTGLILNLFEVQNKSEDFAFHHYVRGLLSKHDLSLDQFLVCVHQIQKSFPVIVDSFSHKIVTNLPKSHGTHRQLGLQIILSRIDLIAGLFLELKSIGLYKFMAHDNESIQHICLMIINKIVNIISQEQISDILDNIMPFADHTDVTCRKTMYEILVKIFISFSEKDNEVTKKTKYGLLRGFSDPDQEIRLMSLNFWCNETRLPTSTLERTLFLLGNMYQPEYEKDFLATATYLILELTSKSPEYNRLIFEHPLSDCKFESYNVNADYRVRHASMLPLFVETMNVDLEESINSNFEISTQPLRATQENLAFTPTQDLRSFDWITQSSGEAFTSSYTDLSSSRFLIKFKQQRDQLNYTEEASRLNETEKSSLSLLRRRFVKNVDLPKKYAIQKAARLQQRRDNMLQQQKLHREAKVVVHRNYRKGDLPDIQIPFSSIIAPLQALAQKNDKIAKLLFTKLIIGIITDSTANPNNENSRVFAKIKESFNSILLETSLYTSTLISAILEINFHFAEEFQLNVNFLASAAELSFQQNTGILLLEKFICSCDKNKHLSDEINSRLLWTQLARLNKSQGNNDMVNGIVSYHFELLKDARNAFDAQAIGNYTLALDMMKKFQSNILASTTEEDDNYELEFWNDATLMCYDRLCQWEKLNNYVIKCFDPNKTENLTSVWDEKNYERYLPYLIKANVKLILEDANNPSFVNFLDTTNKDLDHSERKFYLERYFSQELALLSLVQKDYNRANYYATQRINSFIHDWTSISVLSSFHRKAHLEKLQSVVELESFLQSITQANSSKSAVNLLKLWHYSLPSESLHVHIIDDITANRNLYLKIWENDYENSIKTCDESLVEDIVSNDFLNFINNSRFAFSIRCVEAANLQKNFSFAMLQLKNSMNLYKITNDEVLHQKWVLAYCKTHQLKATVSDMDTKISSLLNVWTNLDKHLSDEEIESSIKIEAKLLHSRNAELFINALKENALALKKLDRRFYERISSKSNSDISTVINNLTKFSYNCLKDATNLSSGNNFTTNIAVAHLQLAKFCDHFLRDYELSKSKLCISIGHSADHLAADVIENHLKAIKYGNEEGIQLFPRLLQILELFPQTSNAFIQLIKEIPEWMFIRWSSQLVAILDKPVAKSIHDLILSIAETYPEALVYNFNVSKLGFRFGTTNEDHQNKVVVTKLETIFDRLRLVSSFIQALEELDHPSSRLKDLLEIKLLSLKDDQAALMKCVHEFYDKEIIEPLTGTGRHGKVAKIFAKDGKSLFDKVFKIKNNKFCEMESKDILTEVRNLVRQFLTMENIGLKLLKDYSDWLGVFSAAKLNVTLEIPGQYTGYKKPLPEYHVKIAKFGETIEVLQSIRKPKAITVIGNDCKEYKYLVKSGEDLRLDQRIQQLFEVMNGIYMRDSICKSKQIKIITYHIVPLTNRLGWLEWVPNTTALKNFIEKGMDEDDKRLYKGCGSRVVAFFEKFMPKNKSYDNVTAIQHAYIKCESRIAIEKYKNIVAESPVDLLKKVFWKMSSSPEAFITLRNSFMISHAVLCISHYILGIGDRHLSNFLVSLTTGEILGIDFGHSFGTAISYLPLPELMPFRLTPQFLTLMEPMREHGLLHCTMVHVLDALRKNPDILINTMDVFIKEPSLDWETFASKQLEMSSIVETRHAKMDSAWYPKQRINFAKQKLTGRNCAFIMMEELDCGVKRDKKLLEKFKEVCLGNNSSYRATLGDHLLSTEKQVLCLIDQATDSHILAMTFPGWSPWV